MTVTKKLKKRRLMHLRYMRKAFVHSDVYMKTLDKSLSPLKGPRSGSRYVCSVCSGTFPKTQIEVDHIIPVTPFHLFQYEMTEKQVHTRLFCKASNLQALCKVCHQEKSKEDMVTRRATKKALKEK